MLTRRVLGQAFRLRPCPTTNAIVLYVIAVLAERYRIAIHAVCVMSNHWHVVLTGPGEPVPRVISGKLRGKPCALLDGKPIKIKFIDPAAAVVGFMRDAHALIARHIGASFGDTDGLWSKVQTNTVDLPTGDDIVKNMVYAVCNPVEAGLVRNGHSWPGARVFWPQRPATVRRPPGFFRSQRAGGNWPEVATLTPARPPGLDQFTDIELTDRITRAIADREAALQQQADQRGARFLGRRAVRTQSRHATPTSPPKHPRFSRRPRVSTVDPDIRAAWQANRRRWEQAYDHARWALLEHGAATTIPFPPGTYKLRVECGVRCEPPS